MSWAGLRITRPEERSRQFQGMRQTIRDQFVLKHAKDGRFIPALFGDIGDSFYLGVPHSHPLALNLVGKIDGKIPTIISK